MPQKRVVLGRKYVQFITETNCNSLVVFLVGNGRYLVDLSAIEKRGEKANFFFVRLFNYARVSISLGEVEEREAEEKFE